MTKESHEAWLAERRPPNLHDRRTFDAAIAKVSPVARRELNGMPAHIYVPYDYPEQEHGDNCWFVWMDLPYGLSRCRSSKWLHESNGWVEVEHNPFTCVCADGYKCPMGMDKR